MTNQPQAVSRRERLRAQTLQEIEDTSFAIIDADGVHALTIANDVSSISWNVWARRRSRRLTVGGWLVIVAS